jgi:hypothetical protein
MQVPAFFVWVFFKAQNRKKASISRTRFFNKKGKAHRFWRAFPRSGNARNIHESLPRGPRSCNPAVTLVRAILVLFQNHHFSSKSAKIEFSKIAFFEDKKLCF